MAARIPTTGESATMSVARVKMTLKTQPCRLQHPGTVSPSTEEKEKLSLSPVWFARNPLKQFEERIQPCYYHVNLHTIQQNCNWLCLIKLTAPGLSNVIALYNLSRNVLPQKVESMGVESLDLSTLARLDHPCQLSSLILLQPREQTNVGCIQSLSFVGSIARKLKSRRHTCRNLDDSKPFAIWKSRTWLQLLQRTLTLQAEKREIRFISFGNLGVSSISITQNAVPYLYDSRPIEYL
jgi:hypothetical protein